MIPTPPAAALRPVCWGRGPTAEFPYQAVVDGSVWSVRVNDFPAQPLYTLLIDGREVADLDEWPPAWQRPA